DIRWHFIGHLQRNKVKYIAPFVDVIHAVDSWRLLQEIDKRAAANARTIQVLLQFKIAQEESKYGLGDEELYQMLETEDWRELTNVEIVGVMGMATFTNDQQQVRAEFQQLSQHFKKLKAQHFTKQDTFTEISMGMSGDYPIALEEGSTMVRVGSKIFGARR
ncbi:MAG: YggS family pyridoxal phosphate-dependent enzyme, partial [Bacteroidota bacterium]